jgi:hypothetical protein
MSFKSFIESIPSAVHGASRVSVQGFEVLRKDLAVTVYSVFVFLLLLLAIPVINTILLAAANSLASEPLFSSQHHMAKMVFVAISFLTSAVCAAILLSYFACAVAASTLAQLEGHPAPLLKGLSLFRTRFRHISKFALLSILYIPIGFIAQKRKLKDGTHFNRAEVIGSSFSLSTAQLAPIILSEDKGVYETVQHSTQTLGKAWREGLVIKVAIYATVFILTLSIGLIPTLVQAYWFDSSTSQEMSRLLTILLVLCLLITAKVLGTVFSSTLYWQVVKKEGNKKLIE